MRQFAAMVLTMQAIVVGLASFVLMSVAHLDKAVAFGWGLGTAALCLVACGVLRFKVGYVLGSLCQVASFAMGIRASSMFFIGAIFAGLWIMALRLGARVDAAKAAAADAANAADGAPDPGAGPAPNRPGMTGM